MGKKPPTACYICGQVRHPTRDHVFPRGLFPKGTLPSHPRPPIAPACKKCQKDVHKHEEYFRTFAAAGSYGDASARALWEGEITRSFEGSPAFKQQFVNAINTVEVTSDGGVFLGHRTQVEGDPTRISAVLHKIIRGLFYLDSGGRVMPFDVAFRFEQITPDTPTMPEAVMNVIHGTPLRTVGDIVRYKFQLLPEEPRLIVSWVALYSKVMFLVSVRPIDQVLPAAAS